MGGLTKVKIDFSTSHLIFPTLIGIVLLILGVMLLVTRRREIVGAGAMWRDTFVRMDKIRFFGTLLLTVLYFVLMVPVGALWPNTGMGFLLCSVPFVASTGILFTHDRRLSKLVPMLIVAVIAPLLTWWLLSEIFFLTLP